MIAIDNTLVTHEGKLIEDAGWFWDHAAQRSVIAHDYLIANYVCPSGKPYALEFRRFRKKADCEAARQALLAGGGPKEAGEEQALQRTTFKDHTVLFQELVDWVVEREIPGDFTFACYFTNAASLNHIQRTERGYVGDLKFNRKVWFQGRELKATELAAEIPPASRNPW